MTETLVYNYMGWGGLGRWSVFVTGL